MSNTNEKAQSAEEYRLGTNWKDYFPFLGMMIKVRENRDNSPMPGINSTGELIGITQDKVLVRFNNELTNWYPINTLKYSFSIPGMFNDAVKLSAESLEMLTERYIKSMADVSLDTERDFKVGYHTGCKTAKSRITQLEQDLAKSQEKCKDLILRVEFLHDAKEQYSTAYNVLMEKCKAYEGALGAISVKRGMYPEYGFSNIAESCIQVAEQALKTSEKH